MDLLYKSTIKTITTTLQNKKQRKYLVEEMKFLKTSELEKIFPGGFSSAPMNKRFSKYLLAPENFRPPATVVYKITPK